MVPLQAAILLAPVSHIYIKYTLNLAYAFEEPETSGIQCEINIFERRLEMLDKLCC